MRFAFISLLLLLSGPLMGATMVLPQMPISDSTGAYSILTGGHLYGAHGNRNSIYPAASFLAHLEEIRASDADAFIALGDIVRGGRDISEVIAFQEVVDQLGMPFLNAFGNHDVVNVCLAPSYLRRLNLAYRVGEDLLLVLHTEGLLAPGRDELGDFLEDVSEAVGQKPVRNLLVFSHRNLPAVSLPGFANMDAFGNEAFIPIADRVKSKSVFEQLSTLPRSGEWWWFVGDVGVHWSVPLLYGEDEDAGVKVLCVGVGDTDRDALAEVTVGENGDVEVNAMALGTRDFEAVEQYTVEYWDKELDRGGAPPEWPAKISNLFVKRSFWAGFLAAGTLALLFLISRRLFSRKSK